ncbi:MAG: hypothetical protein IPP59_03875 [Betaproteobacteria bacterium]|jgi:hypothetical protein|nr:hypothetical protein [Betaproteobacteria bacterium]MBK9783387.1 hypothetical protein [Candidatus Dechloromonas phosphorivorans]
MTANTKDAIESATLTLDCTESLLTSIAAGLTSTTGVPTGATIANSLLAVQRLIAQAKAELDAC